MLVPNVTGGSVVAAFAGWFDLVDFNLSATVAVSSGGTGTGGSAGKAQWVARAALHVQKGSPLLLADADTGKVLSSVKFEVARSLSPLTVPLQVTLTNAIITSVDTSALGPGDQAPAETLTFNFTKVTVDFTPQNADGTAGAVTEVSFDLSTNTGSGGSVQTEDFVVGSPATPPSEAVDAFRAPSQTGPMAFGDAAVMLPVDASVLNDLAFAVSGRVVPTATLEVFTGAPPALFGSYTFTNVIFDSVSLSSLEATATFVATKYQWTVGQDTATFP
jgi:type VI secretion system secreted protein Hcp